MEIPRTMLHMLHEQAARRADRPALWTKRGGSYVPTSWREYARKVRQLSLGLHRLGFSPGDALTIIGFNREEWLLADLAAMALGGVPVGIYTTSSPEQIRYIANHCESPVLVVENEGYLERVMAIRRELPKLRHILVMDPPAHLPEGAVSFQAVLNSGANEDDGIYFERVNALEPGHLATLIYTSGTTGNPKGVMLSHRNLTWTAAQLLASADYHDEECVLSYLPLSHVAEQLASIHVPIMAGAQVYFAESFEKVPQNLKEVRPTVFFGVPRVWEKFKAKAEEGMRTLPAHRRQILAWARKVARERHALDLAGQWVPMPLEIQYRLAQRLVFDKLKSRIGFDRAHIFATSAAPIGKDVLDFFCSLDIVIRELYGQSEASGPTTLNTLGATRLGTLGRPMVGVEVKIADDGEILVRGENVCLGYYKEPEATAELLEGGWLHSGDLGELDADGYLRITGRKKEIIVTSGGKKTPPANLELLLKSIEPLGNALVVGEGRNYLVALLALDVEKVPAFAAAHGFPSDAKALVEHRPFLDYLERRIEAEVNAKVARFETIKRFAVLPHDFTIEGGELTSTLKVRRKVCEQKYQHLIEALYADRESRAV